MPQCDDTMTYDTDNFDAMTVSSECIVSANSECIVSANSEYCVS